MMASKSLGRDYAFSVLAVDELKSELATSGKRGLLLDIDNTLSATAETMAYHLIANFGRGRNFQNDNGDSYGTEGCANDEDLNLSVPQLLEKYQYTFNIPWWRDNPEVKEWSASHRDHEDIQLSLQVIEGAVNGVNALQELLEKTNHTLIGYCTVRPICTSGATIQWLSENKFPPLPVVLRPMDVKFEEGNQWKARVLKELYPNITGIVDDNPKLSIELTKDYLGHIFLYGQGTTKEEYDFAFPCVTWKDVVKNARKIYV